MAECKLEEITVKTFKKLTMELNEEEAYYLRALLGMCSGAIGGPNNRIFNSLYNIKYNWDMVKIDRFQSTLQCENKFTSIKVHDTEKVLKD